MRLEMKSIASMISRAIATDDATTLSGIRAEVKELTARFPIYSA